MDTSISASYVRLLLTKNPRRFRTLHCGRSALSGPSFRACYLPSPSRVRYRVPLVFKMSLILAFLCYLLFFKLSPTLKTLFTFSFLTFQFHRSGTSTISKHIYLVFLAPHHFLLRFCLSIILKLVVFCFLFIIFSL
jgi:hypothetical protein